MHPRTGGEQIAIHLHNLPKRNPEAVVVEGVAPEEVAEALDVDEPEGEDEPLSVLQETVPQFKASKLKMW